MHAPATVHRTTLDSLSAFATSSQAQVAVQGDYKVAAGRVAFAVKIAQPRSATVVHHDVAGDARDVRRSLLAQASAPSAPRLDVWTTP